MIKLAGILALQALVLGADIRIVLPAAALGAFGLSMRPHEARRMLAGFLFFLAMFGTIAVMGAVESLVFGAAAPDLRRAAVLSSRSFASFCAAVAAARMFTLPEALLLFKRLGAPDHILTMTYLLTRDFVTLASLARAASETIRARRDGAGMRKRFKLLSGAAGHFLIMTADKFHHRHEYIQARGLDLDLPIAAWRKSELERQG